MKRDRFWPALASVLLSALTLTTTAAAQNDAWRVVGQFSPKDGTGSLSPQRVAVDTLEAQLGSSRGHLLPLQSMDAAAGSWQVVVYLESSLVNSASVRRAAGLLTEQTEALLDLGSLEIVVASPDPRTVLAPTRDPQLVLQTLDRLALEAQGEDALLSRRLEYVEALGEATEEARSLTQEAVADEVEMQQRQRDELLHWLGSRGMDHATPRLLLLLDLGSGQDPVDFYSQHRPLEEIVPLTRSRPKADELAESLAAFGWITVPLLEPASSEERALTYRPTEELPVGFRLRLGGRDRKENEAAEEEPALTLDPVPAAFWATVEDKTQGRAVADGDALAGFLGELQGRSLLEIEWSPAAAAEPGASASQLEIVDLSDRISVRIPALSDHAPRAVAEARIRRALRGELGEGDVAVEARLTLDPAAVGTRPSEVLAEAALSATAPVRVTVGVHREEGAMLFRHEELLAEAPAAGSYWQYQAELVLPSGTDTAVVLVDALDHDEWGLALIDFVDSKADESDIAARQMAGDRALRLRPEDPGQRSGKVWLVADADDRVQRVVFELNGEEVAERNRPPFRSRIDLGSSRRFSEVLAIGYDADGFEVDRDTLLINEPAESFWVRIVEPRPGRRVGPVDVEASLKLPQGGALERVDFYWGDEQFASRQDAPFRAQARIPIDQPDGFLRVVAILEDGRSAEDVILMNRPGFGAQIGVELVELYVVATDRNGIPVRDLAKGDFTVLEDGQPQAVETFAMAGDLPLTVGLAMDSSSSLFVKLPSVQRAAKDFVKSLVVDRDRAFLVEFGSRPRMVAGITRRLDRIVSGISSLEPFGTTPVWEAITLSLSELERVGGRRALVVFYDGDDEDENFSYRRCLELARSTRVPIYLIVMNDAAARTDGRSFSTRAFVNRLERLAKAGGGRVYYVRTEQNLAEIFQSISDELRSHYLLTYYPKHAAGGPQWRPVEIELNRRGVTARTIEGYGIP